MQSRSYDVLFDGGCGLCTGSVVWLRRLDWFGRLRYVDVQQEWEELEARYPGLHRDACLDEMHVVAADGAVAAGFDGVRTLAWQLPLLAALAPLLYIPGVPWLGRHVYRQVARHRSTTCRLPDASRRESDAR